MTSFACVLYTCRVNASTILALNNAKQGRRNLLRGVLKMENFCDVILMT